VAQDTGEQPDPWLFRASDADRESYLDLLREAYAEGRLDAQEYEERMGLALSAKTYRDLYVLLAELPIEGARIPGPPVAGAGAGGRMVPVSAPGNYPARQPEGGLDNSVLAILSSASRKGPWLVPTELTAVGVLGEVTLDLTSAVLTSATTVIRCNAVLGSVNVIVPDAVQVHVDGSGILGDFNTKDKRKRSDRTRTPAPDAPKIRITGIALLGSVEVRLVVPKGPGLTMLQRPSIEPPPTRREITGPPGDGPA